VSVLGQEADVAAKSGKGEAKPAFQVTPAELATMGASAQIRQLEAERAAWQTRARELLESGGFKVTGALARGRRQTDRQTDGAGFKVTGALAR
jgi:hypothetical protein